MDVLDRPLSEIAAALRERRITAAEMTELAIERHQAFAARLDAYQVWDAEAARAQARAVDADGRAHPRGSLAGLPISVKDLFGVAGYPTFAGTARRLPAAWEREGPVVARLRQQGGVVIGKTRMVELAFGGLGTNPHHGTPRNPWDADAARVPGGSSSGAGVSLHEGSALVALGSDTACSVRTPAAWTGTVGLKTSKGRWSTDGMVPLSPTLDSVGILTRSVADACHAFAALDRGDPLAVAAEIDALAPAGLRLGIPDSSLWGACADDLVAPVQAALRALEARGARLVPCAFPEFDAAGELYGTGFLAAPECCSFVRRRLPAWRELLHETVRARLDAAESVLAPDYLDALDRRRELIAAARQRWAEVDVLVTPTVPITAPRVDEVERLDDYLRWNRHTSRGTNPVNVLDLCALTLPCGLDRLGIPVGLQLIAPHGGDERLLASALWVELILGTPRELLGPPPRCR